MAPEDSRRLLQDVSDAKLSFHTFNKLELPVTMNIEEYGKIRATTVNETFTRYIVKNGPRYYEIDVSLDALINKVTVSGASDLKWIDTKLPGGLGFKREIGKSTKYFIDGVNVLNKQMLPAKAIKKSNTDRKIGGFVTLDIETIRLENKHIPYLICAYNGIDKITSFANSSLDQTELFTNFVNQLLSNSFTTGNNITVYAHNFSRFDGIFLMKHLVGFGKVDPLLFNGKLISLKFKSVSGKTITFKDSMLMLPLSLRELCSAFNINEAKSYFPFNFTDINYTGVLPNF